MQFLFTEAFRLQGKMLRLLVQHTAGYKPTAFWHGCGIVNAYLFCESAKPAQMKIMPVVRVPGLSSREHFPKFADFQYLWNFKSQVIHRKVKTQLVNETSN